MPITVKHGSGDIGALLQLALASGAANMPRVPTSPRGGVSRGGGGGGGRRSGGGGGGGGDTALDRAEAELLLSEREPTLREKAEFEGLKAKLRAEAVAPIELEMMEEEQRLQDEGWERKYSAKQKQDITRDNESIQRIRTMIARGEINPTDGQRMINAVMADRDGINPNLYPPDPSKPPEEQRPGYTGTDDFGNQFTIDSDGNRKIITESRYTPKGLEDAHRRAVQIKQLDMQQKQLDAKKALDDKIREFQYSLRQDETTGTLDEATIERHSVERFGPEAVRAFKGMPSRDTQQGVLQQDAALPTTGAFDQVFEEEKESLTRTKAEQGLPERVAMAQSFLRRAKEMEYAERGSSTMKAAILEALDIIEAYRTERGR